MDRTPADGDASAYPESTARLRASLPALVAAAGRAPSPLNTQPWRFRWRDDAIELLADRTRSLPAADPDGRQLTIACGAALFNLRLAVRHLGVDAVVAPFPDPQDADLLARVSAGAERPPDGTDAALLAALPYRHTHRRPFTDGPVPPEICAALRAAAREEGAELHLVKRPDARARLAALAARADQEQQRDTRLREEIVAWTSPPGAARRDGVPPTAYPRPGTGAQAPFPARDHALGRDQGVDVPDVPAVEPAIAVLTTEADGRDDWLVAGQALQRVLLTAARRWVFASFLGQLMEVDELRPVVRAQLGLRGVPQVVLRIGRATVAVPTPRRDVSDLLEPPAPDAPPPGP